MTLIAGPKTAARTNHRASMRAKDTDQREQCRGAFVVTRDGCGAATSRVPLWAHSTAGSRNAPRATEPGERTLSPYPLCLLPIWGWLRVGPRTHGCAAETCPARRRADERAGSADRDARTAREDMTWGVGTRAGLGAAAHEPSSECVDVPGARARTEHGGRGSVDASTTRPGCAGKDTRYGLSMKYPKYFSTNCAVVAPLAVTFHPIFWSITISGVRSVVQMVVDRLYSGIVWDIE